MSTLCHQRDPSAVGAFAIVSHPQAPGHPPWVPVSVCGTIKGMLQPGTHLQECTCSSRLYEAGSFIPISLTWNTEAGIGLHNQPGAGEPGVD